MPLPGSGPISLGDLRTEFSGPTPHSLTDYYRGGAYVPDSPANIGVPTSGAISLTDFYGASGTVYQAADVSINSTDSEGFAATGNLYYDADGGVRKFQESGGSGAITDQTPWSSSHPNETGGAGWSVRLTHQTGVDTYASGSGLNVWLALSANRSWQFVGPDSGPSTELGTYLIELSNDGGTTVFDSGTLTVSLENEGP